MFFRQQLALCLNKEMKNFRFSEKTLEEKILLPTEVIFLREMESLGGPSREAPDAQYAKPSFTMLYFVLTQKKIIPPTVS